MKWRIGILKTLAWLACAIGVCLALIFLGAEIAVRSCVFRPPPLPPGQAIPAGRPSFADGRAVLGPNSFGMRDGLRVLQLRGAPFDIGYANGVLTSDLISAQEETLRELMQRFVPGRAARFFLRTLVVLRSRHLPAHVSPDLQLEILGLSRGYPDPHPEEGPVFHRFMTYHAAQDISYMLMNNPLVHGGCTAIGARGTATVDGHMLMGRNFDWEAAPIFDTHRVVTLCEPDSGIPFVSVAWAGMCGCVSGLNREGLAIVVNGAPSRLPADIRTPTCIVAREVLQQARTLDEARRLIERREVFVSAIFLVGSRRDGRFLVIEKTPERTAVRDEPDPERVVATNHYRTRALRDSPINIEFLRADTSGSRDTRARELLSRDRRPIDPAAMAALLRDRRLPGGRNAGNGHRATLNPLIATHSLIVDLTEGILWVAVPPHGLGRFVAFDAHDFGRPMPERVLPEDPMLASGEYGDYMRALETLERGRDELRSGAPGRALDRAHEVERLNPGAYRNAWLLGEALLRLGRHAEAVSALETALGREPALARERRHIERLAAQARRAAGSGPGTRIDAGGGMLR